MSSSRRSCLGLSFVLGEQMGGVHCACRPCLILVLPVIIAGVLSASPRAGVRGCVIAVGCHGSLLICGRRANPVKRASITSTYYF